MMKMDEEQQQGDQTRMSDDDELVKGGVKVKIVLTREELERLMFQLKNDQGKKLEEILGEIERGRLSNLSSSSSSTTLMKFLFG
ncbi:hypothetical protein Q3G72_000411 [Acer saccharum]|nr:hypothetical protein Q3G72_000411 [Acer saccharum]